jgi:hypothetical protein
MGQPGYPTPSPLPLSPSPSPTPPEMNSELISILAACHKSTARLAQFLFPERFTRPFSPSHHEIFRVLDDDSIGKAVIAAPRNWGKTSVFDLAFAARNILFKERKVIMLVSCSSGHAVQQSENLKNKLLSNPLIAPIFGAIHPGDVPGVSFNMEKWTTAGGVTVIPVGAGQAIRGTLIQDSRPDLIIVDDLEDKDEVRNEELRKRLDQWLWSDLMGMFDKSNPMNKLVVIGTVLHEDSILSRLLKNPDFHSLRIEMCDDNYVSNWPEYLTTEQVRAMAAEYERAGRLDEFYREFRNLPIALETAHFNRAMFQYYEERDLPRDLEHIVIMDPAKTVNANSDYTAIIGLGIDYQKPAIYVRDLVMKRLYPDQMVSEAFAMADRLQTATIGVEVTSLNEFITHPIEEEMIRRGRFYEILHLKARGKKEDRIGALSPYYRRRVVYHNAAVCEPLEAQLISYPMSQHDDAADALAYVIEAKALGNRFFLPAAPAQVEPLDAMRKRGADESYKPLPDYEGADEGGAGVNWSDVFMEVV